MLCKYWNARKYGDRSRSVLENANTFRGFIENIRAAPSWRNNYKNEWGRRNPFTVNNKHVLPQQLVLLTLSDALQKMKAESGGRILKNLIYASVFHKEDAARCIKGRFFLKSLQLKPPEVHGSGAFRP